jgi:hypothetical protein
MDEFYTEWQKEENKDKGKWDVLDGFSSAHQIAVVFGNFNYQVGNGGIEQWIYNGYCHDDAEKLIEYLEVGAESDERCRAIRDRIYALNQYAQETECDRYGSLHDEDGESGFIGDIIDCNAFDTWYYAKCGEDNWWQAVCEIIDKTAEAEPGIAEESADVPSADTPEVLPQSKNLTWGVGNSMFSVFIENAAHPEFGGFTMPLPASREQLQSWLDGLEISAPSDVAITDVTSSAERLANAVCSCADKEPDLEELNYLAAKVRALSDSETETLSAALEAERHCGSVAELINLTENLGNFELQPAFNAEMLGQHLLDMDADNHASGFEKLYGSDEEDLHGIIDYIKTLEKHFNASEYGKWYAENENGAFTESGYLTENDAEFKTVYRGTEDIPAEYLVFYAQPAVVKDVDLAPFLVKLHALTGCPQRNANHALGTLTALRSTEYLLLLDGINSYLTEAAHVYRNGSETFEAWMDGSDKARAFAIHITDVHGRLTGDVAAPDYMKHRYEVLNAIIRPDHIEAVFKDGSEKTFTPEEWASLPPIERDGAATWTRHFKPEDLQSARRLPEDNRTAHEEHGKPVDEADFLAEMNAAYMKQSENPQPDMLRVSQETAKEMLARGDAEVYRLLPSGAEKLSPMDAVKSGGLWYMNNREFAIRREDIAGLDKWAERTAETAMRRMERGEHKKSQGEEL